MDLFTGLFNRIDNRIVNYASDYSQSVVQVIEPAVITGMSIYFLFQGYRHIKGEVEQPFMVFIDSIVKMVAIVGGGLNAGIYNQYIISTFQDSPVALAAAFGMGGSGTLSGTMGTMLDEAAGNCLDIGLMFFDSGIGMTVGGIVIGSLVMIIGFVVTIYTAFVVLISKVMTGIVLALGPLFISALLFDKTKSFFGNFINTLVNHGLVIVMAFAASTFILSMFRETAAEIAALGTSAQVADLSALIVSGGIGILVMMQVRSAASSLAGGVSLETFGMGNVAGRLARQGASRISGGQGRENQRAAKNQLDVQQRKDKLVARVEAKKKRGGNIKQRNGTTG